MEPTADRSRRNGPPWRQQILLTNRNHSRAANQIRARTGARTAIHPSDAPHARKEGAELDDELNIGDKIDPLVVVGAPGKSPGEVVLHWPERKILIVGDCVVGDPPGRCKLLPEKVIDDLPRLRESVRGLLSLDVRYPACGRRRADSPKRQGGAHPTGCNVSQVDSDSALKNYLLTVVLHLY